MEPIGTIINFYPFLTKETRKLVESIVQDAEGYDDLVSKLVDIVLTQKDTNDLTVFTTIQVVLSGNHEIYKKLLPRLLSDIMLKPWSLRYEEDSISVLNSVKQTLSILPEEWMRLHLLFYGFWQCAEALECQRLLDKTSELIRAQNVLNCFAAEFHIQSGWMHRFEGNLSEAMQQFEKGRIVAKHYNDIVNQFAAQCDYAKTLKETDVFQALALIDEAHQNFISLGANWWASRTAGNMGQLHVIIGEYDLAAEFYRESDRIHEPEIKSDVISFEYNTAYVLSRMYCDIDLPDEALEWIKYAIDCDEITSSVIDSIATDHEVLFQLAVARTLILLGNLEGVPYLFEEAHKQLMKLGHEIELIEYNYVTGLFEVVTGNLDIGLQLMKDAFAEADRLNFQSTINSILLSLAKTEVKNFKKIESGGTESSGPWMTRLGSHAKEKNYPGIMMQHALLKAEYQNQIGETEAALLTLQDALTFSNSLGVKTLRKRILKKLDELETSVDV